MSFLAGTIDERRNQWQARINELEIEMGKATDRQHQLQSKVDGLFTDIFDQESNSVSVEF